MIISRGIKRRYEFMQYKKIIVKVGSNLVTKPNGLLDRRRLAKIVDQIVHMLRQSIEVILVSSGALTAGKGITKLSKSVDVIEERQTLAALGQIKLIGTYSRLFTGAGVHCAQVLATKEDFRDRHHYLNIKNCFNALWKSKVIPVVNENDVVSVDELMFTDNDELAGLIAAMMNADALMILTNVQGLLTGSPDEQDVELITELDPSKESFEHFISPRKSEFGRGGMHTKCRVAARLAGLGIAVYILNGKKDDVIINALNGEVAGTRFIEKRKASNVKKWIAHAKGGEKGEIYINRCLEKQLTSKTEIRSLLPIGITKVSGSFLKGDIIIINNEKGKNLGLGIAKYSSEEAKKLAGKKGGRALIHYDYLFIGNI